MTKSQKTNIAAIILIVLLGLAVYANSLGNGFVYDDEFVIKNTPFLSSWSNLRYFFSPRYFSGSGETTYRPLLTLTYFLDYSLGGPNPFAYHLNNIIFHILSGILCYCFLLYLIPALDNRLPPKSLSLLATLLFICHPIQTEAVNGIAFREDILAALFCFASLIFYLKTKLISGRKKLPFYILSVLCYFFALLSKESALPLILIILLIDLSYQKDAPRIRDPVHPFSIKFTHYFGYIGIICLYLFIRFSWMVSPVAPLAASRGVGYLGGSLYTALLTTSRIFVSYLGLLLFPLRLTVDHYFKYILDPSCSFLEPRVLFSLLILGLILAFIIRSFRYQRILAFSGLWIFIFLLPVSNILPLNQAMAERYLYLPSIGFCLFLGLVLVRFFYLSPNRFMRNTAIVSIVLILFLYSLRTITRNRDWKDSFTLWSKTVETSPNSWKAHNNLGKVYSVIGKTEQAIASYNRAIEIDPNYVKAHINLAVTYYDEKQYTLAIHHCDRAVGLGHRVHPGFLKALEPYR